MNNKEMLRELCCIENNLSKQKYENLRKSLENKNVKLYSYKWLKKNSPNELDFIIESSKMSIDLSCGLNYIFGSIIKSIEDEIDTDSEFANMKLIIKIGFDGAQSNQEINFMSESPKVNDSYIFIVSLVPLFVYCDEMLLWSNNNPGSVESCKPLEILFMKENDIDTYKIFQKYKKLIADFNSESKFLVQAFFTMCDQKAINSSVMVNLLEKKLPCSNRCYICGLLSYGKKSFQEQRNISNTIFENFEFGLSTLHGLINVAKFLIYNVSPVFRKCSKEEAKLINEEEILKVFKIDLSFIKHGFGSKITGNIARRFFKNYNQFSNCINVPVDLIKFFKQLLEICCGFEPTNIEYVYDLVGKILLELENVTLTPALHKYLIHGPLIIDFFQKKI